MRFSSRLPHAGERNRIAQALAARKVAGRPVIDLTQSNPTRAGFTYPPGLLLPLAQDRALVYDPQPFGLPSARQAVSDDFARRGAVVPADRIVLTASTSEAYSLLFKLLCDPGTAVLAPKPSYPLVEHLAELEGIALEYYRLAFHGRWVVEVDELREKLVAGGGRLRAIVTISPNNPTGSVVSGPVVDAMAALARDHELALISDEVFADYTIERAGCGGAGCATALAQKDALAFALGGLSKSVGLPQAKLGWIGVGGPDSLVAEAMDRLETICDAYLSVSTPVQMALPDLLAAAGSVREQIQQRVRDNYAALVSVASAYPACAVLPSEAGWSAVVQVPAIESEETLVLDLLERTGILVHPGYFFDFEREAYLVISLLPEPTPFAFALQALFREIGRPR